MFMTKGEYSVTVEDVRLNLYIYKSAFKEPELINLTTHTHTYTELFACTKGTIRIATEHDILELLEGDVVIIPAGLAHHKIYDTEFSEWKTAAFSIQQCYVRESCELWNKLSKICINVKPCVFRNVPKLCHKISSLYEETSYSVACLPAFRLVLILAELAEKQRVEHLRSPIFHKPNQELARTVFLELFLEQNYRTDITMQELANYLHISVRQASRIIKQQYGEPLHKVLMTKRLNAASYLLQSTNDSIEEICYRVGFKKPSIFYVKFQEQYKVTPAEYRGLYRQEQT